jgi:replication-associated recombination protein RarA
MGYRPLQTKRGYDFGEVASAFQKAIRRGDARLAGYWGLELYDSGFRDYTWKRLLVISAEDCAGIITQEVEALFRSHKFATRGRNEDKRPCRVFVAKAIILLSQAAKCRDADHLIWKVYEAGIEPEILLADLEAARDSIEPIPDYAYDCHTAKGKRAGKTKDDFLKAEFEALKPRVPGLFDPKN